jgi:hypothetical protein
MTALVLEEMRARCPRFQHRLFAVVGVSGGSVGAVLSAAAAADAPRIDNPAACPGAADQGMLQLSKEAPAVRAAEADLLRPLLRGALIFDLPIQLFPIGAVTWLLHNLGKPEWAAGFEGTISWVTDRSRYLEWGVDLAWREATSGQSRSGLPLLERSFAAAWPVPERDVPALVLLATDVASGRRVAVSHLSLGNARAAELKPDVCLPPVLPAGEEERSRLLTLAEIAPGLDLAMPAAAVVSARSPMTTPAATLPCPGPRWRLVDGGYFENSGLTTALDLMEAIAEGAAAARRSVRVVLVRIENGRATTDAQTRAGAPPRDPQGWLAELGSPVRAFLGTPGRTGGSGEADRRPRG